MSDESQGDGGDRPQRPPSEIPFYIRLTGGIALCWGVVATMLQLILVARSSVLRSTVYTFMPGYKGAGPQTTQWNAVALTGTAWVCLAAFFVVIITGILLAGPRRWWVLVICALSTCALAWATASYFLSLMLQIGSVQADDPIPEARIVIAVVAIAAPLAVIATMFILPARVSALRQRKTEVKNA